MLKHLNQWYSLIWFFSQEFVNQVFVLLRGLGFECYLLSHLVTCDGSLVSSVRSVSMYKFIK